MLSMQSTPKRLTADFRNMDLNMLMNLNGKERTESDWKKLFADADPGFELEFEKWECSTHGLVKATWKPCGGQAPTNTAGAEDNRLHT